MKIYDIFREKLELMHQEVVFRCVGSFPEKFKGTPNGKAFLLF
jgi:hypothetical protein